MKKKDNILAIKRPDLAEEWHPTKNGDITPYDRVVGSGHKVWWQCSVCSHEWKHVIRYRVEAKGPTCPICSSLATLNPELAKEWHPTKNGTLSPFDLKPNSRVKVWWQCSVNPEHEWDATVDNRAKGRGCPTCSNRKITKENCLATLNPQLASEWNYDKNKVLSITPYTVGVNSQRKVWWRCSVNPEHEWKAVIGSRNKGVGCPVCSNKVVTAENCLATLNPDLAKEWHPTKNGDLTPKDVSIGCDQKVWWRCEKGHEWKAHIYSRSSGANCGRCSTRTSLPEQLIFHYINQIFTDAENGAYISGSQKTLDVSIPSLKIAIEYDGSRFHQDISKDISKDKLMKKRGWKLIRIRELGCPDISYSSSIQFYRKDKTSKSLEESIYFIFKQISSLYQLTPNQLSKLENIIIDIDKDSSIVKKKAYQLRSIFIYKYPNLAKEWHPTKNKEVTPENVKVSSYELRWWKCQCGHSWQSSIYSRIYNNVSCPECTRRGCSISKEIIEEAISLYFQRKSLNMTVNDIATKLGISRTTINREVKKRREQLSQTG